MESVKPARKKLAQIKKQQKRIGVLERRIQRKRRMLYSRMLDVYDLRNHINLLRQDHKVQQNDLDNMMGRHVEWTHPLIQRNLTDRVVELLLELPPPLAERVTELLTELPPTYQQQQTPVPKLNIVRPISGVSA